MAERVILIDGSWLIFRAYFAIPTSFSNSSGLSTNAIYGFAGMFRKMLGGKTPKYGAVVFDSAAATHRELKYPEYKANRPEIPADLSPQFAWIDKVVHAHNFPLLRLDGYEADDIIGTLAKKADAEGMEVYIVSGDKDFSQLVNDNIRMVDTMRDITYDAELVRKKWGVPPSKFIDLLALMGDKIDNIPGVPSIGQKTAATLLDTYGSLDGIYAHIDDLKGKQKSTLVEHKDQAYLSQDLATITTDIDLGVGFDALELKEPDRGKVNALFLELEFYSLIEKDPERSAERAERSAYRICRTVEEVAAELAALGTEAPAALGLVWSRPHPGGGESAGLAVSPAPEQGFYVPILGDGGLGAAGWDVLRSWLADPAAPKLTFCFREVWRELRRVGVELAGVVGDVQLGSFLIDPTKLVPHTLDRVVKQFLHRTIPEAKTILGAGKSELRFSQVPIEAAGDYACMIADAVGAIWTAQVPLLEEIGLLEHLRTHDLPLSMVLAEMELAGIKVDQPDLKALGEEFATDLAGITATIYELAGRPFNINSPKQLGELLFDELKLPVQKKTKTGYSTAAEVLEKLAADGHTICERIIAHRKLDKLINTYTSVLQQEVNPLTGRVHATFNQTVSVTGRLITTDPDIQRTPVRTREGVRIRQAFIPEPGHRLISADWSQIELRLLAHFTGDERLVEAFQQGADVHRRTASELFGVPLDAVDATQRNIGKTVNFATIYGQGATALAQQLGLDRKEAKRYIDHYFEVYSGVRTWLDATIAQAIADGYVLTLYGRRRYIPELTSNNVITQQFGQRVAANTPIQGSAADLCKAVMLGLPARLADAGLKTRMLLQIHDELVFEAPEADVEASRAIIAEAMETVYPLRVPLVVEVGVGGSWAEAH